MRTLIMALALSVASTNVNAEWASKPIHCDTVSGIISVLKQYEERPLFGGIGNAMSNQGQAFQSPVITFHNTQTGTWTIVEFNTAANQACVLSSGQAPKFNFDDVEMLQPLLGDAT